MQLAGTKKIQQKLCEKNVLENFLSKESCNDLRECFTDQFSLDSYPNLSLNSQIAVDDAIMNGDKWVLKPQREGGGNNY